MKKKGWFVRIWNALREALFDYPTCQKCGRLVLGTHRWKQVWRKRWGVTRQWAEHRDCARPTENPVTYHIGVDVGIPSGDRIVYAPVCFPDHLDLTKPSHMEEYQRRNKAIVERLGWKPSLRAQSGYPGSGVD